VQAPGANDERKAGGIAIDGSTGAENRVIIDGVNVAKRHQRATRATMQGGIIDKDMPIHVSNVAIMCNDCGATRIGYRFEGTDKIRVCRKCGKDL